MIQAVVEVIVEGDVKIVEVLTPGPEAPGVPIGGILVSGLGSAATAGINARQFVTDATVTTFLSVVVGGGGNKVPVVSNGVSWIIG